MKANPFLEPQPLYDHCAWLLDQIRDWIDNEAPAHFDASFVEEMEQLHSEGEILTDGQEQALQNIFDRWVDK